mgnify:CR=1 FL=1
MLVCQFLYSFHFSLRFEITTKYSSTIVLDFTAHLFFKNDEYARINYRQFRGKSFSVFRLKKYFEKNLPTNYSHREIEFEFFCFLLFSHFIDMAWNGTYSHQIILWSAAELSALFSVQNLVLGNLAEGEGEQYIWGRGRAIYMLSRNFTRSWNNKAEEKHK